MPLPMGTPLVPLLSFTAKQPSGWNAGLLGAAEGRGTREQEWEMLNAATWSAGRYAGPRPHHITLPPTLKHTVAAEELLPDRA